MDTSTPRLTVLRTDIEACHIKLDIEVPADQVNHRLDEAVALFRKSARVPGFRPGKTPRALLLKRFGDGIVEEAKKGLIQDAVKQACEMEKVEPETTPRLENEEAVTLLADAPFVFSVSFDTAPQFELPDYKGLPVTKQNTDIKDDAVQEVIDGWLQQRASYGKVDHPAEAGDLLKVTYKGTLQDDGPEPPETAAFFLEAEETWVALREPEIIPGTVAALIGVEAGDVKEIEVTFPEDYSEPSLQGRNAKYNFEILEVHAAQIPELTEEVAKEVGADSVEEVRGRVRKNLEENHEREQEESVRRQIVDSLIEKVDFPLPPTLLRAETHQAFSRIVEANVRSGQNEDDVKSRQQEIAAMAGELAERQLRRYFILRKIAEAEELKVDPQELAQVIEGLSRYHKTPVKTMQRRLQESGRIADIIIGLRENKTIAHLVSLAEVSDRESEPESETEPEAQTPDAEEQETKED